MSEYQYYEFLAMDRPLTGRQVEDLHSILPPPVRMRSTSTGMERSTKVACLNW